jgi:hypothetical protein
MKHTQASGKKFPPDEKSTVRPFRPCTQSKMRHRPRVSSNDIVQSMLNVGTWKADAAQGLLRHARTPTTTDVYQQVLPEGVKSMVDSINKELRGPSTGQAETS